MCALSIVNLNLNLTVYAEVGFCNFEVTLDSSRGEYIWPETVAGRAVSLPCSYSGYTGLGSTAVRFCNASLREWEIPNLDTCYSEITGDIQRIGEVSG